MPNYNIIIPIFNEEENINLINDTIKSLNINHKFTITFIDDGSTDNSLKIIKDICSKDNNNNFISFSRNFGHQIALSAGIDFSNSDAVIMMDADLQHDETVLPKLIKPVLEGRADLAVGTRYAQGGGDGGCTAAARSAWVGGRMRDGIIW